jgi:hypothetical protein
MIVFDTTYTLELTEKADDVVSYNVYKGDNLIGSIAKSGAEIHYTARDTQGNIRGNAATIRETLESMVLHMFYHSRYTNGRYIETLGEWIEGGKVKVEYERNGEVKHGERVVRYSGEAGDLYITLDNRKYFYCEFE